MATTNVNKTEFSIENLAKSSRTENDECDSNEIVNRNPCQGVDFTNHADLYIPVDVYSSPYYTYNGQTSPCISQVHSNYQLGESFRLSPDDGYFSQQNTPSVYRSCRRSMRISDHGDLDRITPVIGRCMKNIYVGDEQHTQCGSSPLRTPNNSLIDSSFETVSPTSDSDEGVGDTPRTKKVKVRTAFSTELIQALERRYQSQRYLPAGERSRLARKYELTAQQVKTWFQNRRMKEKRKKKNDLFPGGMNLPTGGVDVAQLNALGIPCPPPYTINNKHQQLLKVDGITSSPLRALSPKSPMLQTVQHVHFFSRIQPTANSLGTLSAFAASTNSGYR
ncbi:homeobox protein Hox-D1-like [Pecten maximus]|uniref:homeobox protein Hox-D1-like n=1 Tax=Pecten maximus TaxID=6579 RepID=UPI0014585A4F|nr:homeobox protein Hox-D1-like [Pecten maximus]